MIKVFSRRPIDGNYIVTSATVLLDRLRSGRLPALCRGKCLAVLMQTVWLEPSRSAPVATWTLPAAESTLRVLYSLDDGSLSDKSLLSNCHLLVDNHHPDVMSSVICGKSEFLAAHNCICATVRTPGVEIQATSQPSSMPNPCYVTVTTRVGTSENISVVQNRNISLTTSQGLCSGLQTQPAAYSTGDVGPVPEEFCDIQMVSFDAKLVRKLVLLVLRCLDIVTREPADHSKLLCSLFACCCCCCCCRHDEPVRQCLYGEAGTLKR